MDKPFLCRFFISWFLILHLFGCKIPSISIQLVQIADLDMCESMCVSACYMYIFFIVTMYISIPIYAQNIASNSFVYHRPPFMDDLITILLISLCYCRDHQFKSFQLTPFAGRTHLLVCARSRILISHILSLSTIFFALQCSLHVFIYMTYLFFSFYT